jgi:glycosyltransferase involved in cell wall biosynthesis
MATIALDATHTVDSNPTGVGLSSLCLIQALLALRTAHRFKLCYRLSRFKHGRRILRPWMLSEPPGSQFETSWMQEYLTFWLPWNVDLFHSLTPRTPPFRFRRELVTVNDVFVLAGCNYSTTDFQRRFSDLLLQAAERAALVITPSTYTSSELVKYSKVRKEQIRVIPYGVQTPTALISPEVRKFERERLVGQGNIMVLSIGVIQTRKNPINMLRALQDLPEHYHLVLAGGDGYGAEAAHAFISREKLGSRVRVLGYVSSEVIAMLYQAADVFLFPSFEEGFGLPVLEAMSYGLPVVAAGTSSLPEVGGDAALYADPNNPREIAAAVREAVEDAGLRDRLIARGLERAGQFSWRRAAEAVLHVYEEALQM